MNRRRQHRGSALMMVIGLLAIIALLGTSFLAISHMESRRGRAVGVKTQADPVVTGLLARALAAIADGLYMGPAGPYGASQNPGDYVDYPDAQVTHWLASEWQDGGTHWRWLTNIGAGNAGLDQVPIVPELPGYADATAETMINARLFPTGVFDDNGVEYFAAVRIEDLSRFLNINVARSPSVNQPWYLPPVAASPPYTPGIIDLDRFIPQQRAKDAILRGQNVPGPGREGYETNVLPYDYDRLGARQLWQPGENRQYKPFGVADEMFLRWHDPSWQAMQGISREAHRLHAMLYQGYGSEITQAQRRQMTAISTSRSLLRVPQPGRTRRLELRQDRNTGTSSLDDPASQQWLYGELVRAGASTQQALHLVANLWAQISPRAATIEPFKVSLGGQTAYGVVEQLVITDVYVYYSSPTPVADDEEPVHDRGWAVAIELRNPTTSPVDTSTYRLMIGEQPVSFPAAVGIVPPHHGAVLYAHGGQVRQNGTGSKTAANNAFFAFGTSENAPWHEVEQLQAFADPDLRHHLRILREVAEELIPVDAVNAGEIDYAPDPAPADARDTWRIAIRDDGYIGLPGNRRAYRSRHTVAIYLLYGETAEGPRLQRAFNNHRVGRPNADLAHPNTLSYDEVFGGFYLRRTRRVPHSFGDLGMLYVTGPNTNFGLPQRLIQHRTNLARGRLDFFDDLGSRAPNSPYADVPWATVLQELVELVPTDPTRPGGDDLQLHDRIYGRVNINTASRDILEFTMPRSVNFFVGEEINGIEERYTSETLNISGPQNERERIADDIIAYRDRLAGPRDFTDRAATLMLPLRTATDHGGFLTPGEVALPLADWFHRVRLNWTAYDQIDNPQSLPTIVKEPHYLERRNAYYAAISNQIDVRSDTFVVYIYVQLGDGPPADARYSSRHMAIIDRSNCRTPSDSPAILMFAPMD